MDKITRRQALILGEINARPYPLSARWIHESLAKQDLDPHFTETEVDEQLKKLKDGGAIHPTDSTPPRFSITSDGVRLLVNYRRMASEQRK